MIVGTAGHIDHGKTSLIRALTGVDADRLQEEKARGITIDLGYAYQPLPGGGVLGFVDVPGHEKFIHNMLAGVTGIDHALLVVAADDGPMPQTLEHLAILEQLGLTEGVVALTKVDRVDASRRAQAREEVQRMLSSTACAGFDVLSVSSVTGEGLAPLQEHLVRAAAAPARHRRSGGHFRLAIDRSFTLAGIGTVVTGTVFAGRVSVGDRLMISPLGTEVRVRSLHVQNQVAETGGIGQRCALNVVAPQLDKRDITRGQWLLGEPVHAPTDRLDVRLTLLGGNDSGNAKPMQHWTPVHVHLGAKHTTGRVALLTDQPLAAGQSALAQLVLDEPVGALHGDRFIVRDQSARYTLGGGQVLDAFAPPRGRRKPQRAAVLRALEAPSPADALRELLDIQASGVDLAWFAKLHNLQDHELQPLLHAVALHTLHPTRATSGARLVAFSPAHWAQSVSRLLAWLAAYHEHEPDSAGARVDELRRALPDQPPITLVAAILDSLVETENIVRAGSRFQLRGHEVKLNAVELALWERAQTALVAAGLAPPRVADLAVQIGAKAEVLKQLFAKLVRMGQLHAVRREVFFLPAMITALATQTEQLARSNARGVVTVGPFREHTGLPRNLGIPMLEYFDRAGFTWRRDDGRRLRRDSAQVFGSNDAVR